MLSGLFAQETAWYFLATTPVLSAAVLQMWTTSLGDNVGGGDWKEAEWGLSAFPLLSFQVQTLELYFLEHLKADYLKLLT